MSTDKHLDELGEAARLAGSIVTERVDAIVAGAERRAEEIRNEAQRELGEAARRAGTIVTEQIDTIVERAERQAQEIRDEAERDGEEKRRVAVASAQLLLERIGGLERPLGELVMSIRGEMERVAGELGNGNHVDAQAAAIPAETDGSEGLAVDGPPQDAPEAPPVDAVEVTEPESEPEEPLTPPQSSTPEAEPEPVATPEPAADEAEPQAAAPDAESDAAATPEAELPDGSENAPSADSPKQDDARPPAIPVTFPSASKSASEGKPGRGLRTRLGSKRAKSGIFISKEGHCAVCQRTFMAGSPENLELSGWRVNGDVGLCPDCQSEDWQLPEGARLPFRRGGS